MSHFEKEDIVSSELCHKITDIRIDSPEVITEIAQKRKRRKKFAPSGKLNIVAADHPARGSVAVGDEPFAMADRHDLLSRLVYVLQSEWVDGVLGSMDLLEELLILHEMTKKGDKGFLDEKLLIASLNRGGLPGAVWELNDPITGTDAATCKRMNLDGSKMLLRMDSSSKDSLKTLLACARGVREMSDAGLPIFLEPLPVKTERDRYTVVKDPDLLVELASIAAALGNTSRYIWLKFPFTKDFKRVARSTTLPIVILGGDRSPDIEGLLTDLNDALLSGHQVRGAMYGRNVLYPHSADPLKLSEAIGKLVHGEHNLNDAINELFSDFNPKKNKR